MITWTEQDLCIDCKINLRQHDQKRCYSCYCNRQLKLQKLRGKERYIKTCSACGKYYKAINSSSKVCQSCWKESFNITQEGRGYDGQTTHLTIASKIFNRRILKIESIHHINLIQSDNSLCNLLLMLKRDHICLHRKLQIPWIIAKKKNMSFSIIEETRKIIKENNMKVQVLSAVL